MPVQPQLFPNAPDAPAVPPPAADDAADGNAPRPAPLWLQRMSLFILVLFCIYLGGIVAYLPWWKSVWDQNPLLLAHPDVLHILLLGPVRGIVSGFGLLDIWIGISEAIHYREYTAPYPGEPT